MRRAWRMAASERVENWIYFCNYKQPLRLLTVSAHYYCQNHKWTEIFASYIIVNIVVNSYGPRHWTYDEMEISNLPKYTYEMLSVVYFLSCLWTQRTRHYRVINKEASWGQSQQKGKEQFLSLFAIAFVNDSRIIKNVEYTWAELLRVIYLITFCCWSLLRMIIWNKLCLRVIR